MLTYMKLKEQPTSFVAATGLTVAEFEELLPAYQAAYAKHYPSHLTAKGQERQRRVGGGTKGVLRTDADTICYSSWST